MMQTAVRHLLTATAAIVALVSTAVGQQVQTFPFAQRDSTLLLDVYTPSTPRADHAVVVSVFGGGFYAGARNDQYQTRTSQMLAQRGFTVVSIDYRLALRDTAVVKKYNKLTTFDDLFRHCVNLAVEDLSAAIAWVCANAQTLGIDTSKMVLTGSSAGAIAVLQLDWCRCNKQPQSQALPQDWKPMAVIPYAGGIVCRKSELKYNTMPAPTMLLHGKKDKIVAYKQFGLPFNGKMYGSHRVAKQMKKQNIPHWILRVDGVGHEVASWLPESIDIFCCFVNNVANGNKNTTLDATISNAIKPTKWTSMNLFDLYK